MTYHSFSQIELILSQDADKNFLELVKDLECTILVVSHKKTKVYTLNHDGSRQILHKHILYNTGTEKIDLVEEERLFHYIKTQNNFVSVIGATGAAFPEIIKTIEKGQESLTPSLQKFVMSTKGWLVVEWKDLENINNSTHALRWIKNFHRETGIKKAEYRLNGGVYRRLPWEALELYWERAAVQSTSKIIISVTNEGFRSFFEIKGQVKHLSDRSFNCETVDEPESYSRIKNWVEFTAKQIFFQDNKTSCDIYLFLDSNSKHTFFTSRKIISDLEKELKPLEPEIVCHVQFLPEELELKGTLRELMDIKETRLSGFF